MECVVFNPLLSRTQLLFRFLYFFLDTSGIMNQDVTMLIGSYHLTATSVVDLLIIMTMAIIILVVVVHQITKLLRKAWSFFSSSNGRPDQERQLTAQPCQSLPWERRLSPTQFKVTRKEGPMPSTSTSPSRRRRRSVVRRQTPRLIECVDLTQDSDDGNSEE